MEQAEIVWLPRLQLQARANPQLGRPDQEHVAPRVSTRSAAASSAVAQWSSAARHCWPGGPQLGCQHAAGGLPGPVSTGGGHIREHAVLTAAPVIPPYNQYQYTLGLKQVRAVVAQPSTVQSTSNDAIYWVEKYHVTKGHFLPDTAFPSSYRKNVTW